MQRVMSTNTHTVLLNNVFSRGHIIWVRARNAKKDLNRSREYTLAPDAYIISHTNDNEWFALLVWSSRDLVECAPTWCVSECLVYSFFFLKVKCRECCCSVSTFHSHSNRIARRIIRVEQRILYLPFAPITAHNLIIIMNEMIGSDCAFVFYYSALVYIRAVIYLQPPLDISWRRDLIFAPHNRFIESACLYTWHQILIAYICELPRY